MYSYFKNAREPMSSYTHFLGVIFAVVGTVFLFVLNNLTGNFSARMFVLYSGFWRLYAGFVQCQLPSITITKVLS